VSDDLVLPRGLSFEPRGRLGPTLRPMVGPWRGLVVVTDTNALAGRVCHAVELEQPVERLFTSLAITGRSPVYVAPHVVVELVRRLPEIAENNSVDPAAAQAMLWGSVMDGVRVVELEVGDHLVPGVRPLMRVDLDLPLRLRGDPDDVPTAALAEFLAPTVILSADSVFTRFGLANSDAMTWVDRAYRLLDAASVEGDLGDLEAVTELAAELALVGMRAVARAAWRSPLIAAAVIVAATVVAARTGNLRIEPWRTRGHAVATALRPLVDQFVAALERHAQARGQLFVVEASTTPTITQIAARHLARRGQAITPAELRDELRYRGRRIPATRLKAAMTAHRAFVRLPGNRYTVGRPATELLMAAVEARMPG
jgi:hypothetical protein